MSHVCDGYAGVGLHGLGVPERHHETVEPMADAVGGEQLSEHQSQATGLS